MDASAIQRAITRITYEILERNHGADQIAVIGIYSRGVILAKRIVERIAELEQRQVELGALDITTYRDDKVVPNHAEKTKIDFFVHSFQLKEETFRIPYISFLPNKKCNLTIENIQTTKTTKEEYLSKYPDTSLYFAGHINNKWTVEKDFDSIYIPANGEVYFVLLYADTNLPKVYDPWSSLNLYPIEFKMPNDGSLLIQSQNDIGRAHV